MDFTGRATSTTASSWAWAPGPAGAMATAGADIASSMMGAETIAAAAEPLRIAATMPVAAEQPYAAPAYRALRRQCPLQAEQGQQQVMPRFNVAAAVVVKFGVVAAAAAKPGAAVVAVVVMPAAVVVVMKAAAAASNLWRLHKPVGLCWRRRSKPAPPFCFCSSVSAVRSVC